MTLDEAIRQHFENFRLADRPAQNAAYDALMEATGQPVDWAYDVWDSLVADLTHHDNHVRSIAAQLLANLAARSDPEIRIARDFAALLDGTRDERFVTARHTLQSIWKVGLGGPAQRTIVLDALDRRFADCAAEKNCTLIRFDIIQGLRNLYDEVQDEAIRRRATALIETEPDLKYRKKYAAVWK